MPYSKSLAARVRDALRSERGVVEKKLFGGVAFLLHGNMLVGIWEHDLIARVGAEQYEQALTEPHVRAFDVTGRPMRGWVLVEPEGTDSDHQLRQWVERARAFVATLPPK